MRPHCTRRLAPRTAVAAVALVALALAACSAAPHRKVAAPPPLTSTSAAPLPSTPVVQPQSAVAPVDPLTGGKPSKNPVIAVKVDDTADGRPQLGVDKADTVYIEQVEGGLTRLVVVFHSSIPSSVEPVRSVRSNDPELLTQYGPIALVASGGGGDALPAVHSSILRANIQQTGGVGFSRDPARADVGQGDENLVINLPQVIAAIHPAGAKSIGWTWSAATAGLAATPAASQIRTVVGQTPVGFDYDPATRRYVREIGGVVQHAADGAVISTPNVIVQFCAGHINPADVDQAGNSGYFTDTVGSGRVAVFRNGHEITGSWTRPSKAAGTTLRDAQGRPISLNPGGAWVVLAANGAALSR